MEFAVADTPPAPDNRPFGLASSAHLLAPPAPIIAAVPALRVVSACTTKKHTTMSDTDTSGTPAAAPSEPAIVPATPVAPVAAEIPASAPAPTASPEPTLTFGTSRGSGLARGKRTSTPAASAAPAPSGYQPTAIELVTPVREYKNPFAPEEPAPAPAAKETVPTPAPVVETPAAAPAAPIFTPVARVDEIAPAPAVAAPVAATPVEKAPETKAELNILPPAEHKQPAQSWESNPVSEARPERRDDRRRDDRDTFRPARRDENFAPRSERYESGAPRPERGERSDRGEFRRDPRPAQPAPATPAPAAEPKKSGGFFGWVKSLFSSEAEKPSTEKPAGDTAGREPRQGDGFRRRHRGGQGRGGERSGFQGPREGGEYRGGGYPRHEGQGQQGGGDGFRRRRGGRGGGQNRFHDRGDRGPRDHGGDRGGDRSGPQQS